MRARIASGVRARQELFGGVVYVADRDDFFACSRPVFDFVMALSTEYTDVFEPDETATVTLAEMGIVDTVDPSTADKPYSGPSFLGQFQEIPSVGEPLVLNTFATAWCPLQCTYCHADDLMQSYRDNESAADLERVLATARAVPSITAVITGGDPLTRPDRATRLIEGLASEKALVMDTSGVGDIRVLLPVLVKHRVHVRVSLDALSSANDTVRAPNPLVLGKGTPRNASRAGATQTIDRLLEAGIAVTVQTVISKHNERLDELTDMREYLMAAGVRHWVLHLAVKGGKARRVEERAAGSRRGGVLPGSEARNTIISLIRETADRALPIDIRCTDTDSTPNSVFLIGSTGDLYTEGYAHRGKVTLYNAASGRPDLVKDLWPCIDKFGHARRYFNWNGWASQGKGLEDLCVRVRVAEGGQRPKPPIVETETKHRALDIVAVRQRLIDAGFRESGMKSQRDEYFDDAQRTLAAADYVVRLRAEGGEAEIGFKGPRHHGASGEQSRFEIEVPIGSADSVRAALDSQEMNPTWFFEKRRVEFTRAAGEMVVLDEIPEMGWFVEIEGDSSFISDTRAVLTDCLGEPEWDNYAELFRAHKVRQGLADGEIRGASFADQDEPPDARDLRSS